jgi:SAM-dependent MidA family methyltransferase
VRSAADDVADAVSRAGGAIRFDAYLEIALYGPHGFYVGGGRAGRRGDYLTSPEVGPLFGELVARAADRAWHAMGQPERLDVVDVGAGPGTLARSLAAATHEARSAARITAVERTASQRAAHPSGVASTDALPTEIRGLVIANELLDNVPFRLLVMDGGWREAWVARDGDRFVEILRPADSTDVPLPARAPHGARFPVQERAAAWLAGVLASLREGVLVVVDYVRRDDDFAERAWRDWLRTYAGHSRGGHYLGAVGRQDVTCEVSVAQLAVVRPPDRVLAQSEWLAELGIDALVEEGRRAWHAAAARPDVPAVRMRSRAAEAAALTDPAGLGAFTVLEWRV